MITTRAFDMRRRACRLLALALAVGVAPAAAASPSRSGRYTAAVEQGRRAVRALMETSRAPGLSVAVGVDGAVVWSEGFGSADLELSVPVTPKTRFRIGSVSKLITAAALMKLHEDGRVDLDAPVQRYAPSFPEKGAAITPRMLSAHLGGIRHYQAKDYTNGRNIDLEHFDSVEDSLKLFADDPLVAPPGTKYAYSTFGYTLLSRVVEAASGAPFLDTLHERVAGPLRMRDTVGDRVRAIVPNRTEFYSLANDGQLVHARYVDSSYKWAGGGILSTAEDLVRFGSAHLRPGFLRAETLDLMLTPQRTADGAETGVGIGWRVGTDPEGRRIAHHAGSIDGGRAVVVVYRDAGLVVALLSNLSQTPAAVERTAMTIAEPFLDPVATRPGSRAARAALEGTFDYAVEGAESGGAATLELRRAGGALEGWISLSESTTALMPAGGAGASARARVVGLAEDARGARAVVATPLGLFPLRLELEDGALRGTIAVASTSPSPPIEFRATRRRR